MKDKQIENTLHLHSCDEVNNINKGFTNVNYDSGTESYSVPFPFPFQPDPILIPHTNHPTSTRHPSPPCLLRKGGVGS